MDLEKVHAHQPKIQSGSLVEVVKTEDPYVQSYMDYLLGRVVRCEQDEELREHRVSVTKDCMLYSGFAVKAMDQNAYLTPYIGQDAIQRQIISKTAELQDAEKAAKAANAKISEIRPIIENEWFFTEDYIASTVTDVFHQHEKLPDIQQQLDDIIQKIDQIKIIGEDIQETRDFIGDWKREKQETVEKRIPELNAKQEQSYALFGRAIHRTIYNIAGNSSL